MKWDGDILYNSALQSLNGRLAGISEDVRAWGGALPIRGCLSSAVSSVEGTPVAVRLLAYLCCAVESDPE